MVDGVTAKVQGLPDLKAALLAIPRELRRRALRNALAAGARIVQREARRHAPVIKPGDPAVRQGRRKPGTMRKAISVRTSKIARRAGDVGVFVNVRPAKKGQRGGRNPLDPFYWRWQEFGWNPASSATGGYGKAGRRERRRLNKIGAAKRVPGVAFLRKSARMLGQALQVFIQKIGPQIQRFNVTGKGTRL